MADRITSIRNPVIPGFYPDPSICRVRNDFYLVNSSFEYFPGVPIFHSCDLVHWRQIGHCLTRQSQLPLERAAASAGIYAPTIRFHAGRFYMITTNTSINRHLIVSADDPAGPWSEPVLINCGGIDPSLFFDDDGTVYFSCTGQDGIVQAPINVRTGKLRSKLRCVWRGTGGKAPEGPHLYKRGSWYYLMIAEGGTEYGHMETIARSMSPDGPFEPCPHNPILTHRSIGSPYQALGHADLVEDLRGNWWAVFLGVRPQGYPPRYHLGRETFVAPVTWTSDDWPIIGREGRVGTVINVTCGLKECPVPPLVSRDDFDSTTLKLDWAFLRNPREADWSLAAAPGHLRLHGSAVSLNHEDSPAWVGRRQRHLRCEVTTKMRFEPGAANEEAGLTVYMNHRHHYEIARSAGRVLVRRRIGSLQSVVAETPYTAAEIYLRIEADPIEYRFAFAEDGHNWHELATGETAYLSTEVAGGFTGVFCAMYATGNGKPCAVPADFDWFDYQTADLESRRVSPPLARWRVSEIQPKLSSIADALCPEDSANWQDIVAGTDGFLNLHALSGDASGRLYLATNITTAHAGNWTLHLGHDGGCRVFLNGEPIFSDPRLRNPALPGRSRVPLKLRAGEHHLMIAFDLADGRGWGIFTCLEAADEATSRLPFPVVSS